MNGIAVIAHLAGAIALLLWATRMVRTGVTRAYGDVLRQKLRRALRFSLAAVLAGTGMAIALQSSTAVSLLVGSFVGSGIVGGTAGLAAVLGADLGSALVVRILSLDLSLLIPLMLLAGTGVFFWSQQRVWRQLGRVLVGLGLILLSLQMIGDASEPLRESQVLPVITGYLAQDPGTAFLIAAVVTWLFHSSVAAVLLIAALAARGVVPSGLAIMLVLGANLGAGLIAMGLSRAMPAAARAVPLGNLLLRGTFAVAAALAVALLEPSPALLGIGPEAQAIHAHIAFNLAVVMLGLPLAPLVHRTAAALLLRLGAPQKGSAEAPFETDLSVLDPDALSRPAEALANATRAALRLCETVEIMLVRIIALYETYSAEAAEALAALDDEIDRRHAAIKLYLAEIASGKLNEKEARRVQELLGACIKLEQAGDIIVRNMLPHVRKKHERGLTFTPEGWREVADFHAAVLANARLAFNVLVSRDKQTARQLVHEKDRLRERERQTNERHFERLRRGQADSIESSALHLDTIRDLKQINALLASTAYPVLEEEGMLRASRLDAA
ncbi:Na/Pi cotransporter family protein [Chelativorans intermedius]|uniref:Na/Pi cotransporter family protein n=1 Tax=Chelativorans intermedius TaxID=515947 RepID=A0ABV6D9L7_9HYPH|nr:Na/Pi cotransporter family protein [Chelativorans intermedius]MCT8999162.1 Na/Pi cotransporter family protein [Chelativorans intermedius]